MKTPALCVAMLVACGSTAFAGESRPADPDPVIGSRTDRPDGSSAVSIGRRLPTDWDTKVGVDLNLAPPDGAVSNPDLLLHGPAQDRSSGVAWMNLAIPGLSAPFGWDRTTVDARLDPNQEAGKVGTTFARSVPLGSDLSLTLQDQLSLTQPLANETADRVGAASGPSPAPQEQIWAESRSLRLRVQPTGTAFAANATMSTLDNQWHNNLSVEQRLWGPLDALDITTSVTDPGETASSKSITARFRRTW
jgi:hypothetical protein